MIFIKKTFNFTDRWRDGYVGKNPGLLKQLMKKFSNLFIWHCLNHRLEMVSMIQYKLTYARAL